MAGTSRVKSTGLRLRFPSDIGSVIRNERKDRGMSQRELASFAGVSRKWLSDVENGKDTAEVGLVLMVLRKLRIDLLVAERPAPAVDPEAFFGSLSPERLPDAERP